MSKADELAKTIWDYMTSDGRRTVEHLASLVEPYLAGEVKSETERWLIWSVEHIAWWKPDQVGYTTKSEKAGRYSFLEARQIVCDANFGQDAPSETMVNERDTQ